MTYERKLSDISGDALSVEAENEATAKSTSLSGAAKSSEKKLESKYKLIFYFIVKLGISREKTRDVSFNFT